MPGIADGWATLVACEMLPSLLPAAIMRSWTSRRMVRGGPNIGWSSLIPSIEPGNQDITRADRQQLLRHASEQCRLQPAAAVRSHCKEVGIKSLHRARDGVNGRAIANLDGKPRVGV